MKIKDGAIHLSVKEAKATINKRSKYVHTFVNPNGMLIGCDWTLVEVMRAIKTAKTIKVGGPSSRGLGHGLVIFTNDGREVFIKANMDKYSGVDNDLVVSQNTKSGTND